MSMSYRYRFKRKVEGGKTSAIEWEIEALDVRDIDKSIMGVSGIDEALQAMYAAILDEGDTEEAKLEESKKREEK